MKTFRKVNVTKDGSKFSQVKKRMNFFTIFFTNLFAKFSPVILIILISYYTHRSTMSFLSASVPNNKGIGGNTGFRSQNFRYFIIP